MKKQWLDILALVSILCCAILCLGFVIRGEMEEHARVLAASPVPVTMLHKGTVTTEPFEHICINAKAPDITIKEGDEFSVAYNLYSKEKISRLEVADSTLYLETDYAMDWHLGMEDWTLTLTVPRGTQLGDVRMKTLTGNICLSDRNMDNGSFASATGKVVLENMTCRDLDIKTTADHISLLNVEAASASLRSITGSLLLDGSFDTVSGETYTGDCKLFGTLYETAALDTFLGDIDADVPATAVMADSGGPILVNGAEPEKGIMAAAIGPELRLNSFFGRITVDTE